MRIGIRLHDTVPGSFWERMCRAKAQGFDCMHLALSKALPHFNMEDAPRRLDDHLAEQIRGALMIKEMDCAVLGCYLKLAEVDPERLERTRAIYRAHLGFAPKIRAGVVGTETPAAPGPGIDPASDEALDYFIECVRPLVRCAEETGAVLAIEPVVDHIVNSPERMEKTLDELHSDSVAVILDTVNLLTRDNYMNADAIVDDAVARFGDRIRVLHLKDFRVDPEQYRVVPMACGTGQMNFDKLLRFAMERDIPVTLENTTPENAEAARRYLVRRVEVLK